MVTCKEAHLMAIIYRETFQVVTVVDKYLPSATIMGEVVDSSSKSGNPDTSFHVLIDNCHKVRFVTGDHRGNIWIATTVGALMVNSDFKKPEDAVFHVLIDTIYIVVTQAVDIIPAMAIAGQFIMSSTLRPGFYQSLTLGCNPNVVLTVLKDGKIRIYDKNRTELGYFTETGTISHTGIPLKGNTYCIFQDSYPHVWRAIYPKAIPRPRHTT